MGFCTGKLCMVSGLAVGLCTLALGVIIGWVIVPRVVRSKIAEILPLRSNSESWERWENLPVPIQYRVYVFNVNNPAEILEGKAPNVTEMGPYVYSEKRIKTILEVDEDNSTVVYEHKMIFEFDAEASSPRTEDDVLTVVNTPAVLFGLIVESLKSIYPVIGLYNTSIVKMFPTEDSNPLFVKAKVKDYIFKGIPIYCNQSMTLDNVDTAILCEAFRILHPVKTTFLDDFGKNVHSFAFLQYKNSSDGIYKMDLGIKDVTKIGQILSWNGKSSLSIWKGESCNKLVGTDTTVFRPYLEEDDIRSLDIYHTDICRSVKLTYNSTTEFKGVRGRRYVIDKSLYASVLEDTDNHCFCPQSLKEITHYGACLKTGMLELTGCQGAPVIVSNPHFLYADPDYQGKVVGLAPDVMKHQTYLDLEPVGLCLLEENTGYPLKAASRAQINAFLKSIPEINVMKNLPNILTPMIWVEEKVELTDELIGIIYDQLLNILKIVDIGKWVLIVFGIILSLGSCCCYFVNVRRLKRIKSVKRSEND